MLFFFVPLGQSCSVSALSTSLWSGNVQVYAYTHTSQHHAVCMFLGCIGWKRKIYTHTDDTRPYMVHISGSMTALLLYRLIPRGVAPVQFVLFYSSDLFCDLAHAGRFPCNVFVACFWRQAPPTCRPCCCQRVTHHVPCTEPYDTVGAARQRDPGYRVLQWSELSHLTYITMGAMCEIYSAELDGVKVAVKIPRRDCEEPAVAEHDLEVGWAGHGDVS